MQDQTITCKQCGTEFIFSVREQTFFAQKGFSSLPKRCKACRKKRNRRPKGGDAYGGGTYRSPAFEDSAPVQQKTRQTRGPSAGGSRPRQTEYRSPAFRGLEDRGKGIYRSPAFNDQEDVEEIYRAPGFQHGMTTYKDEKPLFSLTCPLCEENVMVPFLPEEEEDAVCPDCAKRQEEAAEDAET